MRGAAGSLGLIAGVIGIFIGMFSVGYSTLVERFGEVPGMFEQWDNLGLVTAVSFISPLFAIAGWGDCADTRALGGDTVDPVGIGNVRGVWFQLGDDVPNWHGWFGRCASDCRGSARRRGRTF